MSDNKIDVTEVVAEANKQLLMLWDKKSIEITGCDLECTLVYSALIRNNKNGADGKNRLSLKDYCKQKDFNHTCIYSIIQDGVKNKEGEIEVEGLKWFSKKEGTYTFYMTIEGVREIYGGHDRPGITPIMLVISGSIYIDDTHELFPTVFNRILEHPSFNDCGGYNEDVKGRGLMFSKSDIKLAEEAGIDLGIKEITNGSQND